MLSTPGWSASSRTAPAGTVAAMPFIIQSGFICFAFLFSRNALTGPWVLSAFSLSALIIFAPRWALPLSLNCLTSTLSANFTMTAISSSGPSVCSASWRSRALSLPCAAEAAHTRRPLKNKITNFLIAEWVIVLLSPLPLTPHGRYIRVHPCQSVAKAPSLHHQVLRPEIPYHHRDRAPRLQEFAGVCEEHEVVLPGNRLPRGLTQGAHLRRVRHQKLAAACMVDEKRLHLAVQQGLRGLGVYDLVAEVEHVSPGCEPEALHLDTPLFFHARAFHPMRRAAGRQYESGHEQPHKSFHAVTAGFKV